MLTHNKHKGYKKELSIKAKLALMRKKLNEYKIDAFLVPHNDMYFNEITAPFHNRLEWITGFTGSAGFAIIFKSSAIVFTDGRYKVWFGRPSESLAEPFLRPYKLSGETTSQKIKQIKEKLILHKEQGFILTCSDSICWLGNIRGQDVPNSPLMNCYAIVYHDHLCIYSKKDTYRDNITKPRKNVTLKHK